MDVSFFPLATHSAHFFTLSLSGLAVALILLLALISSGGNGFYRPPMGVEVIGWTRGADLFS